MSAALSGLRGNHGARGASPTLTLTADALSDVADALEREAARAEIAAAEAWLAAGLLGADTYREVLGIVANFEREADERAKTARAAWAFVLANFKRPPAYPWALGSAATRARHHYDRAALAIEETTASAAEARAVLGLVVQRATVLRFLPLEGEIR